MHAEGREVLRLNSVIKLSSESAPEWQRKPYVLRYLLLIFEGWRVGHFTGEV